MRFRCLLLALLTAVALAAAPVLAMPLPSSAGPAVSDASTDTSGPGAPFLELLAVLAFGMAIRVKPIGDIAKKFVRNAQTAAPDYTEGVRAAGGDWEANTAAGAQNFATGVQQAIADGRFERGVREAGAAKFVTKATTLGAARFGPGVAAAEGEFTRGAAPYLQTIAGLTLPPRRPKGDPGNMERANAVAQALRRQKVGK